MKQKEKSNGNLRERWAERIAGPASAEEMRMWPLMLRTLALNLRAGIPLQEAVHTDPGSGQLGENEPVPGAGKMPAKKTTAKKSLRVRRTRGSSPLSEKRCAEDIRRFMQALAAVRAHPGVAFEQLRAGEVRGRTPGGDRGESLGESVDVFGAPLVPVVIGEGRGASPSSGAGAFLCGGFLCWRFRRARHRFALPQLPGASVGVHRLLQGNTGAQVQCEGAQHERPHAHFLGAGGSGDTLNPALSPEFARASATLLFLLHASSFHVFRYPISGASTQHWIRQKYT